MYDWSGGDSLGNLAMQDRVEVVRGATGLMQGAGNPSAAINMVRKRPTSTWQFKGSASAGSWDDYRLMADVSGPLTEDGRVRARLVGFGQDASDFYDLAFNDKHLGYATLDVDLTENTTLNIGYSHLYSNRNLIWGGMPTSYGYQHLDLSRSTFVGADWEYNKTEADTFYASLAHDFDGGWSLNFNATYVDGRYGMLGTFLLPTPDVGGHGHVWWATQSVRYQKAADLKVSGPVSWFGRKHDLVFGATVNRQNERDTQWFKSWDDPDFLTRGVDLATWNHAIPRPDTSSTSPLRYVYSTRYKQDSLYSVGRFNVADTLDLLLGARLDWYDKVIDTGSSAISFSENANLTKYAGLTWKFADRHSAYVSYTDVFQPQNQRNLNGDLLPPKSGRNYELGVKGEYLGGALNGSIALFRIDENDRAAWLSDQSACTVPAGCYGAAGLVRTEGVDIELQGALAPNWQIGAGLTYSETRYRKDANPDNIGHRLSTADPTTLFKLSTQYTLPGALSRLTLGGRVNWQSKMYRDATNAYGEAVRIQQDARAIVDISASYRLTKNLNLKLDINNVFDKVYYSTIAADDWIWGATEAYGRPRSALLTLNAGY
nr:TonB-dependent siderophore receptor [Pseudothauera rhizosphaerae]